MVEIEWTREALDDIDAIHNYISRDSEYYAKHTIERIFEAIERIRAFPKSGRVVPEFSKDNVREVIRGNYRVVYKLDAGFIRIVTVFHGSRPF